MITKQITYDGSFLEDGQIQVRRITRIMEDGVELSKSYHRHVIDLEDDISKEDSLIQDIANAIRTPKRVAARRAFKRQQELEAV